MNKKAVILCCLVSIACVGLIVLLLGLFGGKKPEKVVEASVAPKQISQSVYTDDIDALLKELNNQTSEVESVPNVLDLSSKAETSNKK